MRKLLIFIIIAILYPPFGLNVQAETDNKNVDAMFESPNNNEKNSLETGIDKPNKVEKQNQDTEEMKPPQFESQFSWLDFLKMFFSLAIVIALIYIILRFINKKNRLFSQMKAIENLGGIPLGTNRSIQLIRLGDRVLVVGVGETIQLLKEITSPDEIEQLMKQNDVQPIQVGQTFLKKILPKNDHNQNPSSSANSFSSILKGQLDDLAEGRKKVYEKIKRDQDE